MKIKKNNRIFVLGLDGATFDLIYPLVQKGRLPHFARLLKESTYGILSSTIPPISAPAWTSFATGVNPGKHGIFGFTKKSADGYSVNFVTGRDCHWPPIWKLLSQEGKNVIVTNIPMSYPPTKVNGILISGLDTPGISASFTYPEEMKKEIFSVVPDYQIGMHLGGSLYKEKRRLKALKKIHSDIDNRLRLTEYLAEKYPWDFFVVKFNNPDLVQHHFWKYMDPEHPYHDSNTKEEFKNAIYGVYEHLDQVLAAVQSFLGSDSTLMVLSDHGAGPRIGKSFRINEWLRREGLLQENSKRALSPLNKIKQGGAELLLPLLLRYISPRIKDMVRQALPNTLGKVATHFKFPDIDWKKTSAYGAEINGIRFNVKGRDPAGIVINETKELEDLRQQVISGLLAECDPENGAPIFEAVFRREEIYHGDACKEAPDLIVIPRDYQYAISNKLFHHSKNGRSLVVQEPHWRGTSGRHRPEGILFIKGEGVRPGTKLTGAHLVDIVPTILHQMHLPIPQDLDGKVLVEGFEETYLRSNPVHYADEGVGNTWEQQAGDVYSPEESKDIQEMLKGLGYIE